MTVHERPAPADNTSAVRTPDGAYAEPPDTIQHVPVQPNVRDRSTAVREYVWRALLRTAMGEPYDFDVVPVYVRTDNIVEVGYVVYIGTPMPVPIGSRVAVASRPFEFDAGEALVSEVVEAAVEALRKARSEALRTP